MNGPQNLFTTRGPVFVVQLSFESPYLQCCHISKIKTASNTDNLPTRSELLF